MNAFCEPPMTISSPHASISRGIVPKPVMASTTKIASVFLTASPIARTSCTAPVEVSDACTNTPFTPGFAASACWSVSGGTAFPYGASRIRTSSPNARVMSTHRSPNFPAVQTMKNNW